MSDARTLTAKDGNEIINNGKFVVFCDNTTKVLSTEDVIDFMLNKGIDIFHIEYAIESAINDGNYYIGDPPFMKIACNNTLNQLIKYNILHPYKDCIESYFSKEPTDE